MAKVKCANCINERIYGLNFTDGVSEDFEDVELLGRLMAKGYELLTEATEETAETEDSEETAESIETEELEEEIPVTNKKNSKKK